MSIAGTADLPLEIFSGLVTDIAPSDLPAGASPANQDVQFFLGGWKTRGGLGGGVFAALGGNPTINYEKTFTDRQRNKRFMFLDSTGNLHQEYPQGTLTNSVNTIPVPAGAYGKSATIYGNEYIAFSDGQFGVGDPSSWDGTNYDRVSQVGPGMAPIAADYQLNSVIVASPNGLIPLSANITSIVGSGFSWTVTLATPIDGLLVGDKVTIAGNAGDGNGTWSISNVVSSSVFVIVTHAITVGGAGGTCSTAQVTLVLSASTTIATGQTVTIAAATNAAYDGTWAVRSGGVGTSFVIVVAAGLAASGGGTIGPSGASGAIIAGVHQCAVLFVTRKGYFTRPSPPVSWTALGNLSAVATQIPTGPSNVVARILLFTTAGGATFFYIGPSATNPVQNMVINDNTTTSLVVSFTDTQLSAGNDVTYLFNLLELEDSAGVVSYATRLFWWGGRNRVPNFINMSFDGGTNTPALGDGVSPLGWTSDAMSGAGVGMSSAGVFGFAWYAKNNATVASNRGMVTQSAYQDYLGNTILLNSTQYSMRVKLSKSGTPTGSFTVELYSPTSGSIATATVDVSTLTGTYAESIVQFSAATPASVLADTILRVYVNYNAIAGSHTVFADSLEIFPTLNPYLGTTMRGSYAGQPESYDALTGVIQPFFQDGGTIRTSYVLRENLYILKDNAWYMVTDDGANEPSSWKVVEISSAVGAAGINAADIGEDWAIVANRSGPYISVGTAEPVKIGQEIQADASGTGKVTWSSINWQYGYTIWVLVDKVNKRFLVGAPTGAATSPNVIFYFDYRGMDNASEMADHWSVKYSSYTGKMLTIGNAPKWGLWNISSNSAAQIERNDGTAHTFIGNGAAAVSTGISNTGKIYDLLDSNKNDDGAGIPYSYTTYLAPSHTDEQNLQIKSHRKLFGYLAGSVKGSGQMSIVMQPTGNITPVSYGPLKLVDPSVTGAITGITRANGLVTVTCAAGHGLTDGIDTQANILNALDSSFNGTVPILQVLNAQQFTFLQYLLPDLTVGAGGTAGRLWREFEIMTNVLGERVSYTFANNGNVAGSWCQMEKIILSLFPDPWSPVRGSVY